MTSRQIAMAVIALLASGPFARAACPIVDAASAFWPLVEHSASLTPDEEVAAFRKEVVAKHPGLYTEAVLGIRDPAQLDREIVAEFAAARRNNMRGRAIAEELQRELPGYVANFRRTFSDFRCDFPIYLAITLSHLDGAGRLVDGHPAMVLGVDSITETPEEIPVFIAHELFHRYHFAAAGFSDDESERAPIWRALWAEGLATYVSARLNPDHPLADAMIVPRNLAELAAPLAPRLARALRNNNASNLALYAEYFEAGSRQAKEDGIPQRSGYYVGYRVAELMAKHHSLYQLAHLRGQALHREINEALDELAGRSAAN